MSAWSVKYRGPDGRDRTAMVLIEDPELKTPQAVQVALEAGEVPRAAFDQGSIVSVAMIEDRRARSFAT